MIHPVGLVVLGVGVQAVPPPTAGSENAAELRQALRAIVAGESSALTELAATLAAGDQAVQAGAVRGRIVREPPRHGPLRFVPLPEFVGANRAGLAGVTAGPGADEARAIRSRTAASLFDLARRAAAPGVEEYGVVTECLRGVLDREPDHREARRLLGFVAYDGGWATPQAAENLRAGMVRHPTFGWVPEAWVEHLERGELPGPITEGQPIPWLPADEADELRRGWAGAWTIRTEHFDIRTNAPLVAAIAFGRRLEALHEVFFTLLADAIPRDRLPLARRVRDPKLWAAPPSRRFQVYDFATRDEYLAYLRDYEGRTDLGESLGIYLEPRRIGNRMEPGRSYFFRDEGGELDVTATLFHEVSHQLLFESAGPSGYDRNVGHFWVWEGLGTYFETLTPRADGSYEVGGLIGPRIAKARRNIVRDGRYTPMAELAAMGKVRFHDREDVYSHYAEAMALTVFFLHFDGGRYRAGFADYVRDAYLGRFRPGGSGRPLPERLGVPAATLDAQFRRFLAEGVRAEPAGGA